MLSGDVLGLATSPMPARSPSKQRRPEEAKSAHFSAGRSIPTLRRRLTAILMADIVAIAG
jgi:hypothetical protein